MNSVRHLAIIMDGNGRWATQRNLPRLEGHMAGIESVPDSSREAALGLGMGAARILRRIELPLAMPVIVAGVRTSVIINIGTAALASTVGAKSLGTDYAGAWDDDGDGPTKAGHRQADRGVDLIRHATPSRSTSSKRPGADSGQRPAGISRHLSVQGTTTVT